MSQNTLEKNIDKKQVVTFGCGPIHKPLQKMGFDVFGAKKQSQLLKREGVPQAHLIVIRSTAIARMSTEAFVAELKRTWPFVDIIVWAPRCSADLVLGVMRAGARDVVLTDAVGSVTALVAKTIADQMIAPRVYSSPEQVTFKFEGMVSRNARMAEVFNDVVQVAQTDANVLILGETGTGKELVARAVHRRSGRKGRFVAINCAAVPENLIDSELFGHVKGAFTGADTDKKGLFRYADKGTLLLDEIGNMPLTAQYHLLRVLQESTIRPVGAHEEIPVDARVIAATSSPLEDLQASGSFREDLFYRLDVFRIIIPPLRERPDDIVFLFSHFSQDLAKHYKLPFPKVTDSFLDALVEYEWPGNVRQLENIAERVVLAHSNQRISRRHLTRLIKPTKSAKVGSSAVTRRQILDNTVDMKTALNPIVAELEYHYLIDVLKMYKGQVQKSADHAGINRRTLLRKMKQYDIDRAKLKTK